MNAAIKLGEELSQWILTHPGYIILLGFCLMAMGGVTIQQSNKAKMKFVGGLLIATGMGLGAYGFWNFVALTYFL